MPNLTNEQEAGRSFPVQPAEKIKEDYRQRDFLVIVFGCLLIVGGLAFVGELSTVAAFIAAALIVGFSWVYYISTSDTERVAFQVAREASEAERNFMLAKSERDLRVSLINALPEPTLFVDADGRVESANAAAQEQFRFVGDSPLLSMVVRRAELLDSVAQVRRSGDAQLFELVLHGETDRYFAGVAAPVPTRDGDGVLVALHDLTQIKRAEFARVDFLANASHELGTPLTAISGFIETIKGPAKDDPEARERFLGIMEKQAKHMQGLVRDLLSLSRIELNEYATPETVVDVGQVVLEVCAGLAPLAEQHEVTISVDKVEPGVDVIGAASELSQVVQNLVDNGVKYSNSGDAVEVSVQSGLAYHDALEVAGRQWEEAGRMSIVSAISSTDGEFAVVRVRDSGEGIDRQFLPRLGERFYRVDQGRGLKPGTGLGLAIVKHVVMRHRGELWVESQLGRGTAFAMIIAESDGDRGKLNSQQETSSRE